MLFLLSITGQRRNNNNIHENFLKTDDHLHACCDFFYNVVYALRLSLKSNLFVVLGVGIVILKLVNPESAVALQK